MVQPNKKYKPEFCQALLDFFNIGPYKEVDVPHYKNGDLTWTDKKLVPNELPSLGKFARSIGVSVSAVESWLQNESCNFHPEFFAAHREARQMRADILNDAAFAGLTPPASYKFMAVNMTDMRDQTNVQLEGPGLMIRIFKDES